LFNLRLAFLKTRLRLSFLLTNHLLNESSLSNLPVFKFTNDIALATASLPSTTKAASKAAAPERKPNLYDLLQLHAAGRAKKVVTDRSKADVVFDLDYAFQTDKIMAELL